MKNVSCLQMPKASPHQSVKLFRFLVAAAVGFILVLLVIKSGLIRHRSSRNPYEVIRYISNTTGYDIQFYVYYYLISITRITRKKYWSELWAVLKKQHYETDVVFNLPKHPSPCIIPEEIRIQYPSKTINVSGTMVKLPALTAIPMGRLGNIMGEYASLLALGKLYNVSVFLHPEMDRSLRPIFPYISMDPLPGAKEAVNLITVSKDGPFNYSPVELAAAGLLGPHFFTISEYPFEMHLFNEIKTDIFEELKFADKICNQVNEFFRGVRNSIQNVTKNDNSTFIGVHVRRTDYEGYLKGYKITNYPGKVYIERALDYYRGLFSSPVFIASSDDKDFLRKHFGSERNFFITPEHPPEVDMAILSSCNHSIFSLGTYGFFSSYLAKGRVVFPNISTNYIFKYTEKFYREANLTNFIPLDAD